MKKLGLYLECRYCRQPATDQFHTIDCPTHRGAISNYFLSPIVVDILMDVDTMQKDADAMQTIISVQQLAICELKRIMDIQRRRLPPGCEGPIS